jgi:hypothetical protein
LANNRNQRFDKWIYNYIASNFIDLQLMIHQVGYMSSSFKVTIVT